MGNNISGAPSMKDQFKKEEKRPEEPKKRGKSRMRELGINNRDSIAIYKSNANRISEEKQSSTLESGKINDEFDKSKNSSCSIIIACVVW